MPCRALPRQTARVSTCSPRWSSSLQVSRQGSCSAQVVIVDHTHTRGVARREPHPRRVSSSHFGSRAASRAWTWCEICYLYGIRRAVVVAKHLCRVGLTCKQMDGLQQWCSASRSRDCCLFRARHQPHRECGSVLQVVRHDVHLNHVTDSCGAGSARTRSLVFRCSRHVAWRTTAGCAMRAISDGQVLAAELFEDFLLKPKLVLL